MSLHVNLSPVTRHLINATTLAWMKPTAVLVNTSRGPVVDQAALADGPPGRRRSGPPALDVTDPEPIPMDDPLVGLDNCLIVPHIASASRATRGKMAAMAAANLLAGVRGEPLPTPSSPPVELIRCPSLDEATRTQIRNIEASTGRSMDDWVALVGASGRTKHGEIVAWLKSEHGLTHGNANLIALTALRGPAAPTGDALVDAIYAGPKATLRPFHDEVIDAGPGVRP